MTAAFRKLKSGTRRRNPATDAIATRNVRAEWFTEQSENSLVAI
jgi:hypothetical protein